MSHGPSGVIVGDHLVRAVFEGDLQAVERLLDAGADIDAEGRIWNALHTAIESENIDCVRLLIERGADVEHRAAGDLTPLAHAVDVAIDGADQHGGTPGDERTELIELLLQAGADPAPALEAARGYRSAKLIDLLAAAASRYN
jgi:ankyrin repeat protein